jgi:hypothetical protein
MRLRAHNPSVAPEESEEVNFKNNKNVSRQCIYKTKIPVQKENIDPDQDKGKKK